MNKHIFRIGIIGSDSSHAEVFSKLINIPISKNQDYMFPDCKVVAIYGHDKQTTKEVAERSQIEFIASSPEELMDKVDAVMIVFRDGNLHAEYALPFIEAGIPTWIDKPFAIRNEDVENIINAAKKHNTLITGGSTCKYADEIVRAKDIIKSGEGIGKLITASMNFTASFNNPYGGIYFYGAHLLEMALELFGYNPKAVVSSINKEDMISILKYDDYQVVLNFIEKIDEYSLVMIGEKGAMLRNIDISEVYKQGLAKFIEMLRTKEMPFPIDNLLVAVKVFNAIVESSKSKSEVKVII
jgi:predicted dehydrogenase